jgi:hypothetical protein
LFPVSCTNSTTCLHEQTRRMMHNKCFLCLSFSREYHENGSKALTFPSQLAWAPFVQRQALYPSSAMPQKMSTYRASFSVMLHSLHLVIRFTFATRAPPTHTGALQCVVIYRVRYSIRQLANVDTQVLPHPPVA